MAGDETIGEAVRQLGRAVGSLARALVGTVRRSRPVPRPESGPPQAWLDLVAETDPEWLATSRWAGRATSETRRRRRRETGATRRRDDEPSARRARADADSAPRHLRPERRKEPTRAVDREPTGATNQAPTRADATATDLSTSTSTSRDHIHDTPSVSLDQDRPVRRETPLPRLVPVERSVEDSVDATTAEAPSRRTARLIQPASSADPAPEVQPVESRPVRPRTEPPHRTDPDPYDPPDRARTLWPVTSAGQRDRRRPTSYGPLAEHVRELPGTWPSHPVPEPRRQEAEPRLATTEAPRWPELPPTEPLDDQNSVPRPGLAAVLWDLDGRSDTLTTAQRRS